MKSIREYWKTWPARRVARKDSLYCFLTSIFASYPPESFKMICFTCIWSQFVYTSFHSSQNPQQNPCRISQFSKTRGVKLITYRGLELAKSICAPNLEATGSNAKFCEFISFYKITKIVRALWLAERRVCMRVCKHGCDVKMFCFSRANHASTNLKKVLSWKTRQVYFIYPFPRRLKLEKSLETCWVHLFLLELTF